MNAIALRALAVAALCGAVAAFVWAPWSATDPAATLIGADGTPIADDGSFKPVADDAGAATHVLVRHQMPEPKAEPALGEGVAALSFPELWKDGEFSLDVPDDERLGRPSLSEFPAGSTAEDVMMFFLDIGDMRSFQPKVGAVRDELDGKRVRIAGYTTPVGFAENETRFLLVPVLGACIHVPPPPPNQIVYVEHVEGAAEMFAPVWVTGTLRAAPVATVLADAGYQLEDAVAEPYR